MAKRRNDFLYYAANLIGFSMAIYFIAYFVLSFLSGLFLPLFFKGATLANPIAVPEWVMGLVNLILSQGSLALAYLIIRLGQTDNVQCNISLAIPHDNRLWLFVPIFLGIGIFLNVITTLFARFASTVTSYKPPAAMPLPNGALGLIIYFIAICVVPAIMEELLVRGAMQGLLMHWGPWFAILVSSFAFALLHSDITAMPSIFILSIILGLTAYCTQSIIPGMFLHFSNNVLAFIVNFAVQKGDSAPTQAFTVYIMAVIIVSALICITLAVKSKVYSQLKAIPRFHDPKNRQSRFERLVCAPVYIAMMVMLSIRAILPLVISK
ncbi:MAG: CPBP family intramembrane glutamic endopeptidase [Oscillospiraceae bacterium]